MGGIPEYFAESLWEKGKKERNQDSLAFWWMKKKKKHSILAIVCDGIGGLSEGENASTYLVKQMVCWFVSEGYREKSVTILEKRVQQLFYQLHTEIKEYGREKGITLGTTVSMVLIKNRKVLWLHCGDSRIYILKQKKIIQLTKDDKEHTGALNKALGAGEWYLPQTGQTRLGNKDRILLCTDGFYRGLKEDEIRVMMGQKVCEEERVSRILKQVYQKKCAMGEKDDITAVLLGFRREGI